MPHLNEEQLVAHYYRDADASEHLEACPRCRTELEMLCRVLALVEELPIPERGDHYGDQVWNRLRWRLDRRQRRTGLSTLAAAAVLAVAFLLGRYYRQDHVREAIVTGPRQLATTNTTPAGVAAAPFQGTGTNDRILVFIVGDHLDSAGRMLMEVANADPKKILDISSEQQRAGELVAANRIYRQTATQRGDARIATLLSDLEPILVELSHAGATLSREELASMQKRIVSKGLLFKVRVMSAPAGPDAEPSAPGQNTL